MEERFPPTGFVQVDSAVEGIEVFKIAPKVETAPPVEVFKCPQCGATTSFDLSKSELACPHCGYVSGFFQSKVGLSAPEQEFQEDVVRSSSLGWGTNRKDLACQQCGAVVSIPPETLASTCPFCGSNRVINRAGEQDHIRPLFLIPFKIKPESCKEIAQQWLGNSWMTPAELKSVAALDTFTPIFIPYWTFDSTCSGAWRAEVGREETEFYTENGQQKTRIVIRWRWQNGAVNKQFEDLLLPATAQHSQKTMQKIGNYRLQDLAPYQSGYLAGIQAQSYDISLENAWESARQKMRDETRRACIAQTGSPHVRNFSMELDFADESWRFILVPVFTSVFRFNGASFQIMLNGQTGEIAGPRPVDWTKVWLVIAAILSPGVLLGIIGLITAFFGIGIVVGILAFILLLIGMIAGVILFRQAQELDDV